MYLRFHYNSNQKQSSAGTFHANLGQSQTEEYQGWQIIISHCSIGRTIRREQFNVVIRRAEPACEEYLSCFTSREAALARAKRRIELLSTGSSASAWPQHRPSARALRRS